MSNDNELKEGDWVRDILTDEVSQVELSGYAMYPLKIQKEVFLLDGKISASHKNPRFIKCDPPKKKVKKVMHGFANIYADGDVFMYSSAESAQLQFTSGEDTRIHRAVPATLIYEVEE